MTFRTGACASSALIMAAALFSLQLFGTGAEARSSYFTSRGCKNCHIEATSVTCNGCHYHSGRLTATKNKKGAYLPGERVTLTLAAEGAGPGWISARLYDHSGAEIARTGGHQSGMGGATVFPAVISVPAPTAPGKYTWSIACFGSDNGSGAGDIHVEKAVKVSVVVAAPR